MSKKRPSLEEALANLDKEAAPISDPRTGLPKKEAASSVRAIDHPQEYPPSLQDYNPLQEVQTQEKLRALKMERLKRLQEQVWREHPMKWLVERLGEKEEDFVWSKRPAYKDHKWDGTPDPLALAWQQIAKRQWVGIEAATGTSKTYMLSRIVLWFLDTHPDSLVVTSAPKQEQLKLHLWSELTKVFHKFKRLRPSAEALSLKLKVEGNKVVEDDEADLANSWMAVGFIAGTGADEKSATRAQGFHREHMLIITEETPGMPNAVMTAFKNTSTGGNNIILAVGNPDSQLDPLHQFCELANVVHVRVSAFDYPNIVEKHENIPGAVTLASIERRKLDYGENSPLYLSRVRGISPAQSVGSLIKLEWITQCRQLEEVENVTGWVQAAGVDVANSERGDKGCVAAGEGPRLTFLKEFVCPNATHLAYNLIMDADELQEEGYLDYGLPNLKALRYDADYVGVDTVGVGVATFNAFKDKMWDVVSLQGRQWDEAIPLDGPVEEGGKPMYRFANLRTQMWYEAREDLRRKQVSIDIEDEELWSLLKLELTAPKMMVSDNMIVLEGKKEIIKRIGKSPNTADAFVYWNWVRKGYRASVDALPMMGGR